MHHCYDYLGTTVAAKNEKFWKILHSNFQFKNKNNNNKKQEIQVSNGTFAIN